MLIRKCIVTLLYILCQCAIVGGVKKPSVVLIGDVCIDHNSIEGREYKSWGSGTLYMGVYCAQRLGVQPTVVTSYGPDFATFAPPEVRLLPTKPTATRTMLNQNIVTLGRRTQYSHYAEETRLPVIDAMLETSLRTADIIVVTVLTPTFTPAYLERLLALVPQEAVKILCPQGYFRDIQADGSYKPRPFYEADELLPLFDMVSLSIEDYPAVMSAATAWSNVTPQTPIIITEAERGAVIVHAGQRTEVPTSPIALPNIVDPTGAGDVFAMSAALDFATNRDIVRAVRAGHNETRSKLLGSKPSTSSASDTLSASLASSVV